MSTSKSTRGFTILELLIVVVIIAILATLLFPVARQVQTSAERARCMANLRSLHVSLSGYIQDKGQWPQAPLDAPEEEYQEWWMNALKDYGATPRVWLCPTILREMDEHDVEERPMIHYTPTPFDAHRITPYRWSTQPWLAEMGGLHPGGHLFIFPDGSIRSMEDVFPGSTTKPVK